MTTTESTATAAWTRLAEPPHREGCPCPPHTLARCYPCRHTGEILTGAQWAAAEIYDGVVWSGESLVEAIKSRLDHERYLRQHPERRQSYDHDWTGEQHGELALSAWFEHSPADIVALVRHCESDAHDGYDCDPAYDDPNCLAGTCRHIQCDRQRSYERLAAASEAD